MLSQFFKDIHKPGALEYSHEEYKKIIDDIRIFGIYPQIFQLLRKREKIEKTPDFFRQRLQNKFKEATLHNLLIRHQEDKLLQLYEQKKLEVMPLKGTRFAERYYGHIGARISTDIDLFVPKKRLDEAIHYAEAEGYVFEIVKYHHARLHKPGASSLELHWTLDKLQWSDLHAEPFWENISSIEPYQFVKELSLTNTFYFICLHGARHHMDSVRYILDVAQIIWKYGEKVDYQALFEQTAYDKTMKRVQSVLSIVYDVFPQLHVIKPLPFQTLNVKWGYSTIRNAKLGIKNKKYYEYKLYFHHCMFDTFKHQVKSLRKAY